MVDYWNAFETVKFQNAMEVVAEFRSRHATPLSRTSTGLRSFVRSALSINPVVSQRLKRIPQIVRKLAKPTSGELARLEDIGGTRVIVDTLEQQVKLGQHIQKIWGEKIVRQPRNYVVEPKTSGYRAIHYIVQNHGLNIEIQVRTAAQQNWANAVEQADSILRLNLKDGQGPEELLNYFAIAGELLYLEESGDDIPPQLQAAFTKAQDASIEAGYFRRRGEGD